jgi:hypothetical protein
MAHLHALENGATPSRISTDLDVVVNARVVSGAVPLFVALIEEGGFANDGMSPDEAVHRCVRGNVSIDVIAPDGLGEREDLTTTPPGRTLEVRAGTQALQRTELLPVETRSRSGLGGCRGFESLSAHANVQVRKGHASDPRSRIQELPKKFSIPWMAKSQGAGSTRAVLRSGVVRCCPREARATRGSAWSCCSWSP